VTTTDAFEQRIAETLRTKVAHLPPVTMAFDDPQLSTVEDPPRRSRWSVLVAATIALVVLLAAAGITAAVRSQDNAKEPAGPPTGAPVAHLTIRALPSLSFQAKELTTVAGVNEITFVGEGGSEGLVFDDPALSYFHLAAPTGPSVMKVDLREGRDYRIHSPIPGHTAAGLDAVIHVLPPGAPGTPPLPAAVLTEVSKMSTLWNGPKHGEVDFVLTNRSAGVKGAMGDEVFDEQPVYVFVMHGSFVARYPRGFSDQARPPSGHTLTFVITRDGSPSPLDDGVGGPERDLSLLGGAMTTHF
jgi:hypothetical protein